MKVWLVLAAAALFAGPQEERGEKKIKLDDAQRRAAGIEVVPVERRPLPAIVVREMKLR